VTQDPDDRVRHRICQDPQWKTVTRLGAAVSGGGDSMALLHLLSDCARERGVVLQVATVDHGLRPEAAVEARFVKQACEALDCHHETLRWEGWDGRGNLQAEARRARYGLLGAWAKRRGLDLVALGHTLDDQAETFLKRLGREAGVDGLAAMDAVFSRAGARFWRPLLALDRAALRECLNQRNVTWREDPSNDDTRFDRVKARRALVALAPLGIDAGKLANVSANLASARSALERCAFETAEEIAREDRGDILFHEARLIATPREIRRRLLGAALVWVSGAAYKPRREALDAAIREGRAQTLHGCHITLDHGSVRIAREFNAVKDVRASLGAVWDKRWRVTGPARDGLEIRALGEGVKDCPDWRNTSLPRRSLMASPATWQGNTLIAAPIAGLSGGFSAELDHPRGDFVTSLLSH